MPFLTCTLIQEKCLAVFCVTMWQNLETVAKFDFPAKILGLGAKLRVEKHSRGFSRGAESSAQIHHILKLGDL